jgi:hypothetical protein
MLGELSAAPASPMMPIIATLRISPLQVQMLTENVMYFLQPAFFALAQTRRVKVSVFALWEPTCRMTARTARNFSLPAWISRLILGVSSQHFSMYERHGLTRDMTFRIHDGAP